MKPAIHPKAPAKKKYGNIFNFLAEKAKKRITDPIDKKDTDYRVLKKHLKNDWAYCRSFEKYDACFSESIKKATGKEGIMDFLKTRFVETKQPVSVLDDGMGSGYFLKDLKSIALENGIPNITTGITLTELENRYFNENKKHIDNIKYIKTEEFSPKQKYDLITSYYGGFEYTYEHIKKETLLRLAYSLKKGGILCIKFSLAYYLKFTGKSFDFIYKLESALRKRGFELINSDIINDANNIVIVIKRIK